MRKIALVLAVLTVLVLVIVFYPTNVEKPVKDGPGPLSVRIDASYTAPEYHSPLDWWYKHHWEIVNRGDVAQADCLYCHVPETSCNNCHAYVGANPIVAEP
ncbi:MAG: hypothetical protein AB1894_21470 [Chloroflexota bacterium]